MPSAKLHLSIPLNAKNISLRKILINIGPKIDPCKTPLSPGTEYCIDLDSLSSIL